MSGTLQTIDHASLIVQQASSDDDMVSLWLGKYRRSAHTRRGYEIDARTFRAFTGKPLRQVTARDVQAFADTLTNLAPATQARRLSAVKSLIKLAHRIGYLPFDVAAPLQLPVVKDTLIERIMSEWDMQRMLGLERNPRNAALLRLLYLGGLRISEACQVQWRDLTPRDDSMQLNVLGKGGKTRPVMLPKPLWDRISILRGPAGPDDPIFRSREGGALDPSQVHRIVKIAARRAKLSAEVSAHWYRHAHISHSLDHGAPPHVVRATVGHASLETTTRYIHVRPGDSSSRYLTA